MIVCVAVGGTYYVLEVSRITLRFASYLPYATGDTSQAYSMFLNLQIKLFNDTLGYHRLTTLN